MPFALCGLALRHQRLCGKLFFLRPIETQPLLFPAPCWKRVKLQCRILRVSSNEPVASDYAGRPSVCRYCGALVGAGESACAQCGTPVTAATASSQKAVARPVYDSATLNFARAVLTRPATFTYIFLAANVLLYLLMSFSGGASGETLVAYGAKLNRLINQGGEWWRFITPVFLHISVPGLGPAHILMNMYGLWMLGPYVERLYGSAKFVVFWIVAGVAGVLASYLTLRPNMSVGFLSGFLFKATDGPSAGASGALFGLIGVLFVFGLKFRRELPEGFKRAFGTGMLPVILMNLFIGFIGRGLIDNAAHLGGLVAGAALALLVDYKRPGKRGPVALFWHILQVGALALVVVSFFMVSRNYNGPPLQFSLASLQRGFTGGRGNAEPYIKALNEGTTAFVKSFQELNASTIDPAIATINNTPSLDPTPDALLAELKSLLERARDLINSRSEKSKTPPQSKEQYDKLIADFKAWQEKNKQWVTNNGPQYGIEWRETPPVKDGDANK